MVSTVVGGVLAFLIAFFALSVYLDVDVAVAGVIAAITSIAAMVIVTIWSRK